jgi:thiosulfate reductase cytochrome b subunit
MNRPEATAAAAALADGRVAMDALHDGDAAIGEPHEVALAVGQPQDGGGVMDELHGGGTAIDGLHEGSGGGGRADEAPRHSLTVRITHWINALSFLAFLLSGFAILLAYPRLHWGEEGALGMPSILDLPLPFVLELGIRGPGRYIHFLTAWIFVVNGIVYLVSGFRTRHFKKDLVPERRDLGWRPMLQVVLDHLRLKRSTQEELDHYNVVQRLFYLVVVFFLLPSMFITGLAMSPMVTSVIPELPRMLGGHQSARTLHFFTACTLLFFFIVHVTLVLTTGFVARMREMITGRRAIAEPSR